MRSPAEVDGHRTDGVEISLLKGSPMAPRKKTTSSSEPAAAPEKPAAAEAPAKAPAKKKAAAPKAAKPAAEKKAKAPAAKKTAAAPKAPKEAKPKAAAKPAKAAAKPAAKKAAAPKKAAADKPAKAVKAPKAAKEAKPKAEKPGKPAAAKKVAAPKKEKAAKAPKAAPAAKRPAARRTAKPAGSSKKEGDLATAPNNDPSHLPPVVIQPATAPDIPPPPAPAGAAVLSAAEMHRLQVAELINALRHEIAHVGASLETAAERVGGELRQQLAGLQQALDSLTVDGAIADDLDKANLLEKTARRLSDFRAAETFTFGEAAKLLKRVAKATGKLR